MQSHILQNGLHNGSEVVAAELDVVGKAVQVLRLDGEAGGAEASE